VQATGYVAIGTVLALAVVYVVYRIVRDGRRRDVG